MRDFLKFLLFNFPVMILGNLGDITKLSTIQSCALSLCNKGKNDRIPCIFPAYQGICPYFKSIISLILISG